MPKQKCLQMQQSQPHNNIYAAMSLNPLMDYRILFAMAYTAFKLKTGQII